MRSGVTEAQMSPDQIAPPPLNDITWVIPFTYEINMYGDLYGHLYIGLYMRGNIPTERGGGGGALSPSTPAQPDLG